MNILTGNQPFDNLHVVPTKTGDSIRAGTGLLSMMAARAMDSSGAKEGVGTKGIVSACETYLPMIKLLRKVLHINGLEKKIRIIPKRSDEVKVGFDISSHADILVSEILDSELLGEGLIPTLQHAHDELLVQNPRTVPHRATIYGQLVESEFLCKLHDLHNCEAKALDGKRLAPVGLETIIGVKPQQYAMHCNALSEDIRLLSEPFKIFEFDFWKRPDSHGITDLHINATGDGTVQAVISWWVLQLDYEGTIFYSTAPRWISFPFNTEELQTHSPNWCDHWKQCVWFVPGTGVSIVKDKQVHIQAVHDDISVSYNLKYDNHRIDPGHYNAHSRDCQLILSPERIAIYGDIDWRFSMLTALRNALQEKVCSLCVVADDSVFLTILIASLSTSEVISVFPGIQEKGARYLQAVADANGFSMDCVKVLGKKRCLTMDDTNQKKVDMLVGEPFYYGNEGMLPWQNLRFWKERTILDAVLSKDVWIMPCKGILKACAMSLPDLWKSRCSLKKVEGFEHSVVNASLGACGDISASQEGPCLPYFIWQCGEIKELSEVFTVMEFDFSKPISPCFGKTKVEFINTGLCHGFVLWIDWVLDAESSIVLSTGPDHRYWKQGVKLLSKPVAVGIQGSCGGTDECRSTEVEASFDPSNGELTINHSFL
ncbi:Protein arginine N-methyltransferase [Macleaya cordata]|uniref:Protein arginine N-methyltransferase n=1 Tax=Macleaya cordata TaxID=56857 RepID=A0A200QSJ4_MACCD|nr:Protein arginine N-methyltransferase [Macleaya cordata]